MELDIEQIKDSYASFDNYKIEHLAKYEINSLRPEVVAILKNEIKKRKLDTNLNKGIEAQQNVLNDISVLNNAKAKISNLHCPDCNFHGPPLVGIVIREITAFVFISRSAQVPLILCQSCANKKRKRAIIITSILGWWGVMSFFKTLYTLYLYYREPNQQEEISDSIITQYALENIGEITTNWEKEDLLVELIRQKNQTEFLFS